MARFLDAVLLIGKRENPGQMRWFADRAARELDAGRLKDLDNNICQKNLDLALGVAAIFSSAEIVGCPIMEEETFRRISARINPFIEIYSRSKLAFVLSPMRDTKKESKLAAFAWYMLNLGVQNKPPEKLQKSLRISTPEISAFRKVTNEELSQIYTDVSVQIRELRDIIVGLPAITMISVTSSSPRGRKTYYFRS